MRTGSDSPGRYTSSNRLARPTTLMSSRPRSSSTRALVPFEQVAAEPARERLFHRGEVVLTLLVADLEPAVVGPLRDGVLEHGHRGDDLGALQVRDVEALDAQRRLG